MSKAIFIGSQPPMGLMVFFDHLFVPSKLVHRAPNTVRRYRASIRNFETTLGRTATIEDLTKRSIEQHSDFVRSEKAIERDAAHLIAIWREAARLELPVATPPPKSKRGRKPQVELMPALVAPVNDSFVSAEHRDLTLEDFLDHFYWPMNPSLHTKTLDRHRIGLRKFAAFLGRVPLLADLTNQTVGMFVVDLAKRATLEPSTINGIRAKLVALWRHAHTLDMISVGPVIKPLIEPAKIPTALTIEQLKRLKAAFDTLQGHTNGVPNADIIRACFSIQFATAARVGAVLKLRFDDIDFDSRVITFRAEIRKGGRLPLVKAVPEYVLRDIEQIRSSTRETVFPKSMHDSTKIWLLYRRLFDRAGVPRPRWKSSHLLRSTHATMVWMAGGNASESLGHSTESMTRNHYLDFRKKPNRAHLNLPDLSDPVEKESLP